MLSDRVQVPSPLVGEGQGEGAAGKSVTTKDLHPSPFPPRGKGRKKRESTSE